MSGFKEKDFYCLITTVDRQMSILFQPRINAISMINLFSLHSPYATVSRFLLGERYIILYVPKCEAEALHSTLRRQTRFFFRGRSDQPNSGDEEVSQNCLRYESGNLKDAICTHTRRPYP